MKDIPQYSIVIFPTPEQLDLVKSYKQLLRNHLGRWFNSFNAQGHITIIQFNTELDFLMYIDEIRRFCKTALSQDIRLNSLGNFNESGAFFIAPDRQSKTYLDMLVVNLHESLGFKIDPEDVNTHMSIARKLKNNETEAAFELFETIDIDLAFCCDALYVRKFNIETKQYSDIVEKIHFGNC